MTGDDPQTRAAIATALNACADDLEIRAERYDDGLADGYNAAAEYLRACADKYKTTKGDD